MYQLVVEKKKLPMQQYDYIFDSLVNFYPIGNILTVPLTGRYNIAIKEDKVEKIKEFIAMEDNYHSLMIDLICPSSVVDYLTMRNTTMAIKDKQSPYETFIALISDKAMLFDDKRTISLLYNSISHEYNDMNDILNALISEYGEKTELTKAMVSKKVLLTDIVYPRQVLMAYLEMDRYREFKLRKCIECMGNDVVLGAMIKNIKALIKEKQNYFKTGKQNWQAQRVDTRNLLLLYRIFVIERNRLNDVVLLLDFYERGIVNDSLFRRDDEFTG